MAAPTQLLGNSTASNAIDLTWVESSSNVASFNVLRGQGQGSLQTVGTVPAGTTVFHDTGLTADTKYTYEVVAVGSDGSTATSNPTIDNTLASFQVNPHVEPQRVGGWQWALPSNRVDAMTHQRNNVFYQGQPVVFYLQWNTGQATTYEVRDYWGNMVDHGTTPADSRDFTLNVTNPGWYKIVIYSNTSNATFGDQVAGTTFSILRNNPNFPTMPSKSVQDSNPGQDEVVRGVTAMGPQRHNVTDVTQPAAMIAGIQPELALDEQYYLNNGNGPDPVRPRDELLAFSNGTADLADPTQNATYLAGVRQIVQAFHGQIKYYEGRNEPNFFESPAQYVSEIRDLYNTVKSVDPTCKVIGPGCVDISSGYGLVWLDQFLSDGGGQYIDAISFHAYNNLNGDVFLARDSMNNLLGILGKYGLQNIPLWQTEQGAPADVYGSFQPEQQGSWDMMQMMLYEQYGITKEHNDLWYDRSGYWDVPDFWEVADDGQLMPIVPLMRTWSEELYATTFKSAFDFGATGNKLFLGDLFTGPSGKAVAAFMSTGQSNGTLTLNVSSGSSVQVTDGFGNSKTMPVINGQVTLTNVPELPVYIDLAPGQTVTPVPIDYGTDLAMLPGVQLKTSGDGINPMNTAAANDISKVNDGIMQSWYENQSAAGEPWYDDTPAGQKPTFEIDLPSQQTVGHVIVYSSVPWSIRGSILDYDLQYQDASGNWQTIQHTQVNPKTVGVESTWLHSTVDSYYSGQWIFQNDFTPVTTSKLRILVNSVTYGGGATQEVVQAGGQTGPAVLSLREIEVYGPDGSQQSPTPPVPTPQPVGSSKFIKEDKTTQGNWQGVYGADGHDIVADGTNIPSYAQVSISGGNPFVWGYSTTDVRAMQMPGSSNRVASAWYGGIFYADVNVTDGLTHQVALYAMDWDNTGRQEKIDVIDPVTGKVETTRYLSGFQNGEYEVFQVTGHVLFRVTLTGGSNSVLNGLFFDTPAQPSPPAPIPPPPVTPPPPPPAVPPTATNDSYSVAENGTLSATAATGVLVNDTDPNNKPLTAQLVSGPANAASFTLNPDGSFSFVPAANFNGSTQFTYEANDGTLNSNVATVTLQVTPVNQPPVAVNDAKATYRNQALTFPVSDLLANDSPGPANEAGQQLTLGGITTTSAAKGTVTLNPNGTITYAPPSGFIGTDTFQYTVTDNGTTNGAPDPKSATATVTVQVNGRPPVAVVGTSSATITAGSALTLDASGSSSPDNAPLSYQWTFGDGSTGTGATVSHVYTATGAFTATVTVSDGAYTSQASEHVTVNPAPLPPPPPPPTPTPTPPPPSTGAVGFVGVDTSTQGSWKGVYGADGEVIPNDSTTLPSYATATTSNAWTYTWTGSTTDTRALQTANGSTRIASTWYGNTFDIGVNVTDGQTHQVALYVLDWDHTGRAEQIQMINAATGSVVDSRSVSNFGNGEYVVYNVSGNTDFRVSYQAGANTVVGGLFFGTSTPSQTPTPTPPPPVVPPPPPPPPVVPPPPPPVVPPSPPAPTGTSSAQFLGTDTSTQGNWVGHYGANGYETVAGATSIPAYAQVSVNGASEWTWNGAATDGTALQQPGSNTRVAATLYSSSSFDVDVNLTDGQVHKLSAVLMNYDGQWRTEQVQVIDAASGKVLDTETAGNFTGDEYLSWNVQGNVILRFSNVAGLNAVLSGLFFG